MRNETIIALSEKEFLLANGMNKEKLEQYKKEGMPYAKDNGENFFYGNAIDWIRKRNKESLGDTLRTAMKKGLNPHES